MELNLGRPGKVGNPGPTGRTIHLERSITLQDIYVGGKIKIKFDRHRLCPQCHGRGGIEGGLKPCPHCAHTHDVGRHVVSDLLGNTFSQKNERHVKQPALSLVLTLLNLFVLPKLHKYPNTQTTQTKQQ